MQILDRDKFTCQKCQDSTSTLHVHHKAYLRDVDPWDHPNTLLLTLCETCHEEEGEMRKASSSDLVAVISSSGAMSEDLWALFRAFIDTANSQKQLCNEEWSILAFSIGRILASRLGEDNRAIWNSLERDYFQFLMKKRDRGGQQ